MKGIALFFFCCFCLLSVSAQRVCNQEEYNRQLVAEMPSMQKKTSEIETLTMVQRSLNSNSPKPPLPAVIVIPVVVHIVYNYPQDNISDDQVKSQIDVLNEDFRGMNADRSQIPSLFASLAADCGITFRLATTDPQGYQTNGITRRKTNIQLFGVDDRIKVSAKGGEDPWNSEKYLNIWVCRMAGGVLGYSTTPGSPANKDGVVISNRCFGRVGSLSPEFNRGRTATHEIGHWLNLKHIWGDTYCGDDKVDDTPKQTTSNNGCPKNDPKYQRKGCDGKDAFDMYMNFMDLTNDPCMNMFTKGQSERMRALFVEGGARAKLLYSTGLDSSVVVAPPPQPIQKIEVNLFPNPTSNYLSIEVKGSPANAVNDFAIFDRYGQPVMMNQLGTNKKQVVINGLKPGIYYLHIGGSVTKFIKL